MHNKPFLLTDIWRTLNKIRAAVFRVNLNLWEYFKPLDPNNNALISESLFVSVFTGPLKGPIGLSDQEIGELADYFRVQDGRCFYTQLCDVVHSSVPDFGDNPPLVTGLEWEDPLHVNRLSVSEERRLCVLLTKIATTVKLRDIVLRPYFQDYELIAKNTGTVTFAHFARIFYFLGIRVSDEDFHLLVKRFVKDSYTINYIAFTNSIDEIVRYLDRRGIMDLGGDMLKQFPGRLINAELPKLPRPEIGKFHVPSIFGTQSTFHPILNAERHKKETIEIMRRIQKHVLANRIRLCEFFSQFDPLNSGMVTEHQFKRGLDSIGVSGLHRLWLSPTEIEMVCIQYRDPTDDTRICWVTFEDDVNQVFTKREMEKYPELLVQTPPIEVVELPRDGAEDWQSVVPERRNLCEDAVVKVKQRSVQRGLPLKVPFNDYDKLNTGHVTRSQMRQCLQTLGILLSAEELYAMELRYNDDLGFNYYWFLSEADPKPPEDPLFLAYNKVTKVLNAVDKKLPKPENREKDIVRVIAKIKTKIVQERIDLLDFTKDYDKNNEQTISEENFYRALNLARLNLTPTEMETLIITFKSTKRAGMVDFKRFIEVIEEAFTQPCLERAPLLTPVQYVPPTDDDRNFMNFEERHLLSMAMEKLSKKPDSVMNLSEVFHDFDKENCGTVTEGQFLRALAVRGMGVMISSTEMAMVFKCFGVARGFRNEVDYRGFLRALEILHATAKFNPF